MTGPGAGAVGAGAAGDEAASRTRAYSCAKPQSFAVCSSINPAYQCALALSVRSWVS